MVSAGNILGKYTFLIVDDHALFREGLHRLLSDHGIENIFEAPDGESAIELVEKISPDIILMDLYMPGLNGIEVTKIVAAQNPAILIIILTVSEEDNLIAEALLGGAHGFLNKNIHSEEIICSLHSLLKGTVPLSKPVTRDLVHHLTTDKASSLYYHASTDQDTFCQIISAREKEILSVLALGMSNKEIAAKLYISEFTVKNHVQSIFKKLQVNSRTQAVIKAMNCGLIK